MFHINNNDEAKQCRAKQPQNCRFYKGEDDTRHYESVSEAQSFIETKLAAEHGTTEKQTRYSFVKEFKKQEDQFNEDFEGIPNRFFNTDLRDNFVPRDASYEELAVGARSFYLSKLNNKMIMSVSQPSDNAISDEQAEELMKEQGYDNVVKIENSSILANMKSNRAWKATLEDKDVIIIDGNPGIKSLSASYAFRTDNDYIKRYKYFYKIDLRRLAGNKRLEKKTGVDLIKSSIKTKSFKEEQEKFNNHMSELLEKSDLSTYLSDEQKKVVIQTIKRANYGKTQSIKVLEGLEDAQLEGKNFLAQKKYIKESNSNVARAFEDLKNVDPVHQDLAKKSKLNKYFRKIEIDNDVDPAEFASFEKDYEDVVSKLPKIPAGEEPELRLRKLGKHKAHGVYFAHKDVVTIDIHNSGSTVHELAHQYDIRVKKNASLRKEFRNITAEYTKNLKIPAGEPQSRAEYLSTPTEIFARSLECYAANKLGVDNRLINKEKFNNYDHKPFENPELREKVFSFIDSLYEEDKA